MAEVPEGAFGSTVHSDIITQLNKRAEIRKKSNKTAKELACLNSNTPWILLRSGVNTKTADGGYSSSEAKSFVLAGGSLLAGDIGFSQRYGVGLSSNDRAAYSKGSMGFRPKPGITSIEVKTKDTWGCIMEAIVHFDVWSLDDLEAIDRLYFRPGMTALLEWGHSVYVTNGGEVKAAEVGSMIVPNSMFLDESCTYDKLDAKVQSCREQSNGNYEGMFGYITNFSYAFRKNGSYDCTVKLLSKGTVIEGIKIGKAKDNGKGKGDEDKNNLVDTIKSVYHQILEDLIDEYKTTDPVSFHDVTFYPARIQRKIRWLISDYLYYVRLDDLLNILNSLNFPEEHYDANFIGPVEPAKAIFQTGETYRHYSSFAEMFSLNPYVAVIPCSSDATQIQISGHDPWNIYSVVKGSKSTGKFVIGDILINFNYIVELVDHVLDDKTDRFDLVEVVQTLLANIQKAFGNVNEFGLQYNHVTDMWSVVDRSCPDIGQKPGTIPISGVGTSVRELDIHSEVSPEIANEMSIAATAPASAGGRTSADASMINWNEGSKNRHAITTRDLNKSEDSGESDDEEEIAVGSGSIWYNKEAFIDFMDKAYKLYCKFTGPDQEGVAGGKIGDVSESAYAEIQLTAEALYAKYINRDIANRRTAGSLQTGIIPIKLGFTVDGISRFNIGTSFKVSPGILPSKYNSWGYIITGIENRVDKSGWVTTVHTQYYPIWGSTAKTTTTNQTTSNSVGV